MTHRQRIRFLRILALNPTITTEEARADACAYCDPGDEPVVVPASPPPSADGEADRETTRPAGSGRGD